MKYNYETRYNKDWMPFAHPLGFIRLILLVEWDPIRMFGEPGAMDEYDSYAVQVHDLLQSDASVSDIAAYLSRVQSELMSMKTDSERLLLLAGKIWRTYHRACDAGEDYECENSQ